jgi:hypothetical protein
MRVYLVRFENGNMKIFASGGKLHWIKNIYKRWKYGAGCCDTYSLDCYLAKKILAGLREFREQTYGYPQDFTSIEAWREALDCIIWSFEEEYEKEDDWEDKSITPEQRREKYEKVQKGFRLFGEYYTSLWL